jgi:hypothetical protein
MMKMSVPVEMMNTLGFLENDVRFQFPLYKLFFVLAVYAVAFGAFSYLGNVGIIIATLIGTTGGLMVIVIRDRKAILSAVIVAGGSLIGAFFATSLFVPAIVNRYTIADCARACVVVTIGAILGGLLFSWASKR